jgi:hypothetical protein
VRGTRRTSSPVDGVADRGANAGRDGRACGKREEGRSAASQTGGEGGCVRPWGCHTGAAWGLAPIGGRRPDCDLGTVRAGGASLFQIGAR